MISRIWLITLSLILLAAACNNKSSTSGSVADTPANRKAAAQRYLKAMPPEGMLHNVIINLTSKLPEKDRQRFLEAQNDKDLVQKVYDISERALIRNFTPDELNAMADFYGSPAGKSARPKFSPYMMEIMPRISKEVRNKIVKMQVGDIKEPSPPGAPQGAKPPTAAAPPEPAKPAQPQPPQPQNK